METATLDIKALRAAAGITQHELADRIGVSQPLVAQWEAGKKSPNAAAIELLSAAVSGEEPYTPTEMLPEPRDCYPAAPSEAAARRIWMDTRNALIREGKRETYNPSGTEGKGVPRVEKKAKNR